MCAFIKEVMERRGEACQAGQARKAGRQAAAEVKGRAMLLKEAWRHGGMKNQVVSTQVKKGRRWEAPNVKR